MSEDEHEVTQLISIPNSSSAADGNDNVSILETELGSIQTDRKIMQSGTYDAQCPVHLECQASSPLSMDKLHLAQLADSHIMPTIVALDPPTQSLAAPFGQEKLPNLVSINHGDPCIEAGVAGPHLEITLSVPIPSSDLSIQSLESPVRIRK
ncbi:hypothetical protein P691DRAFT_766703 [Macrolepiota fuliginosa MF-IS2]|uniref:Uncharacterized protein n=1 Tax=Macrolepiota fuliginosa MF-IS2 TaxID=1400762 RepID=A0A9P5X044_9AGAR|nr:hypothetical protein P691DRAFT_766703 [Macrolepiota fuliginosa MF-IS2]